MAQAEYDLVVASDLGIILDMADDVRRPSFIWEIPDYMKGLRFFGGAIGAGWCAPCGLGTVRIWCIAVARRRIPASGSKTITLLVVFV